MTDKDDVESHGIRPGMGVLALLQAIDYDAWYALGELVDNAVASYRQNRDLLIATDDKYQFRVQIDYDNNAGVMTVRDNAAGIAGSDYARALVTGEPPLDRSDLNRFGMGMKSACCWWCNRWTLSTTALGEPLRRDVTFDVAAIVRDETEEIQVVRTPASKEDHFTEIRMESLTKSLYGQTMGKSKKHLASIYRRLLQNGELVLEVNGEELAYQSPTPLVARQVGEPEGAPEIRWERELSFTVDGKAVSGVALIRETGATKENGLSLFWHDRLVTGSADEPYRPSEIYGGGNSFKSQRLSVEVDLNDFDVNNTKTNFVWPDGNEAFITGLKEALDAPESFRHQAENWRSTEPSKTEEGEGIASESVKNAVEPIGAMGESIEAAIREGFNPIADRATPGVVPKFAEERTVVIDQNDWTVRVELVDEPTGSSNWMAVVADPPGKSRTVRIKVNRSSPFALNFGTLSVEQLEPQLRLAIGIGLAETLAVDGGFKEAPYLRELLNGLLAAQLAEPA